MMSSSDESVEAQVVDINKSALYSGDKSSLLAQVDTETVFRLIDSILPFEACLYHQVVPLSLEGSRIKLGMVTLEDTSAIDYVRRILAYMNCSLVPHTISLELHHAVLSAYLSYSGNQNQATKRATTKKSRITQAVATESAESQVGDRPATPLSDRNTAATFLVDRPEDLLDEAGVRPPNVIEPTPPPQTTPTAVPEMTGATTQPQGESLTQPAPPIIDIDDDTPTQVLAPPVPLKVDSNSINQPNVLLRSETAPPFLTPNTALPVLEVQAKHLADPVEILATLSAPNLLQELLGRILMGGIGRLYFQRQEHQGRIIWSQNGVPQSVLDSVPMDTFQALISELKQLTRIPLVPVRKPKQVEIERLYQRQRLLLRLRVMPGTCGEEATLQILRGAALKFYQQQQLTTLSRDALSIAQELQGKIDELRTRTRDYPSLASGQLNLLPALNEVIKNVEHQLELLRIMQMEAARREESR
jgi:hypothetical protein